MKTEELTALGLTEEQAAKVFALHGKELTAEQKKTEKAAQERDGFKERLETAEATLKNFEGIDPAKIQQELADWKEKAQNAEKDFKSQLTLRDQQDWLKAKLDEYGVASPYYTSTINEGVQRYIGGETVYDGVTFNITER